MQYLSLLFLCFSSFAQNSASHVPGLDVANLKNPMKVESVSGAPENAAAGARFPISVTLTLPAGFHAYEDKFKVSPLSPDGMQISETVLKSPKDFTDYSGAIHKGLEDRGTLEVFVDLPKTIDAPVTLLKFDLEYIACTKKFCLPRNTLSFDVPVHMSAAAAASAESKSSYIEQKLEQNLFLAFILVFFFGFLTSLTPCVYPLIPITLAVIGARTAQSKKSRAFALSVVYVLGIAMTYSILGVVAAQTGALFGQALSYPPVIIVFACLFFVMGLSLFGLFEIRAPHFITKRLSHGQGGTGFVGAFLSGLVAGVIASPCVGPVLVGILAYIAKTQDVVLGFTLLFTFAMGMGLLFIAIGTSSSLIKKLPRSGGWMNGIKYALGVCMILLGLYYLRPLMHPRAETNTADATEVASTVPLKNSWQPYSKKRLDQAVADGKPVIIDFFATWCGACMELDEKSFSLPLFINASKDFVLLKVDATENFVGLADLQRTYKVFGLPTIIFLSKSGKQVQEQSLTGFEDADKILLRMKAAQAAP